MELLLAYHYEQFNITFNSFIIYKIIKFIYKMIKFLNSLLIIFIIFI